MPKGKQNPALGDQLIREEAEGILAWLVQGLANWKAAGLHLPQSMQQWQQEWRSESDDLGLWLAEECISKKDAAANSADLYASYKGWRIANNLFVESTVVFARKMKQHGFTKRARA